LVTRNPQSETRIGNRVNGSSASQKKESFMNTSSLFSEVPNCRARDRAQDRRNGFTGADANACGYSADGILFASFFGSSTAIDTHTIAIGAFNDTNGLGINSGSAYVFERKSTGWFEVARMLSPNGQTSESYGNRVAVGGGTVAVGSLFHRQCAGWRNLSFPESAQCMVPGCCPASERRRGPLRIHLQPRHGWQNPAGRFGTSVAAIGARSWKGLKK
jgi:hypothetical protein